jgi:hypothetical protein
MRLYGTAFQPLAATPVGFAGEAGRRLIGYGVFAF